MLSKAFYAIFLFSFIIDILIRQNEKELTNNNVSSNSRQQDLIPNESDDKVENIEIPEKNKISHGSSLKIKQGEKDLNMRMISTLPEEKKQENDEKRKQDYQMRIENTKTFSQVTIIYIN